jgi:hypothetical protein
VISPKSERGSYELRTGGHAAQSLKGGGERGNYLRHGGGQGICAIGTGCLASGGGEEPSKAWPGCGPSAGGAAGSASSAPERLFLQTAERGVGFAPGSADECTNAPSLARGFSICTVTIEYPNLSVLLVTKLSLSSRDMMILRVKTIFLFISHIMSYQRKWLELHIYTWSR